MTNQEFYDIQVAYALKDQQTVIDLKVKPGTTILQAIEASGISSTHPEIDLNNLTVGIYARMQTSETILKNGDRVEIYRPLKLTQKIKKTDKITVEI